jgi:chemotaxis protein MotD
MMSARIDSPAAAPSPRAAPMRVGGQEGESPRFDNDLREVEAGPLAQDKDALGPDADFASPQVAAPSVAAPIAAPAALDALLAQLLPQQQPQAPIEARRASVAVGEKLPRSELNHERDDSALCARSAGSAPAIFGEGPTRVSHQASDDRSSQDSPSDGKPFAQELRAEAQHSRRTERDDAPLGQTRNVVIREVTTAQHFPITADPVRQIANVVTRSLETPSAGRPADPQTQPVKTISVQLEPESLGSVTLRMRLSGNQLSVRVDVAEPATLDMIQRERDRLQKSMSGDNVTIERLDIRAAREPAPVLSGDNANAPKQDMNEPSRNPSGQSASGRQSRQDDSRSDLRGESHADRRDSARETHSDRRDSRGLYL